MSTDARPTRPRPFDLDAGWQLHPQVSVRPERFGALLYHFGTRQLSFLKSPKLLAVVRHLRGKPECRDLLNQFISSGDQHGHRPSEERPEPKPPTEIEPI